MWNHFTSCKVVPPSGSYTFYSLNIHLLVYLMYKNTSVMHITTINMLYKHTTLFCKGTTPESDAMFPKTMWHHRPKEMKHGIVLSFILLCLFFHITL